MTGENKQQIERERVKAEAREADGTHGRAGRWRRSSRRSRSSIARRVGENDTLYGSVTAADIAEALAARDVTIDRRKIQLGDPLKALGEHAVPVKLYRDVTANAQGQIVPAP